MGLLWQNPKTLDLLALESDVLGELFDGEVQAVIGVHD